MASRSRGGAGIASLDSVATSTSSIRCCRSRNHTANGTPLSIDAPFRLECLQHALFQNQHLLLGVFQRGLAVAKQFGASLIGGERFLKRQLAAFHRRNDFFELGERGLKTCGRFWDRSHRKERERRCGTLTGGSLGPDPVETPLAGPPAAAWLCRFCEQFQGLDPRTNGLIY